MAHIPATAAIFSPSVARLASSTAKDWNYVDSWLSSKFPNRSPPPFERNPETLRALVALAALNESADEDHGLISSFEASAGQTLSDAEDGERSGPEYGPDAIKASPAAVADRITVSIESYLSREGCSAFESLAATSVELGVAFPAPAAMGRKVTDLHMYLSQLERAFSRTNALCQHVDDQLVELQCRFEEQARDGYRPSASLAKQNLELQRRRKVGTTRLHDAKEKCSAPVKPPETSVQQLANDEAIFLTLLDYNNVLIKQIKAFKDLPPDTELAKLHIEALRAELHATTQKRDIVFEGLVEKATPKRSR
ncbi:hypothetical protein Sste5346_007362 [Sporothrix stenoceras]|uniref:Uncharacterized protein n=1 Tax=Sporothrix stenoceras TaxID=5173 RepID=A0ABR3YTV8_9PEZI